MRFATEDVKNWVSVFRRELVASDEAREHLSVSDDGHHIVWKGESYTLTDKQALMFRELLQSFRAGHPDVHKDKLLEAAQSEGSSLKDLWSDSPLWMKLMKSGRRAGTYRLALEQRKRLGPKSPLQTEVEGTGTEEKPGSEKELEGEKKRDAKLRKDLQW